MNPPSILLTGFGPFPGAPVNPTEALVERLRRFPPAPDGMGAFHAAVLDVDYATIARQLAVLGAAARPDIAIHFGLARECRGFRLERVACNSHADARPDNSGALPATAAICAGPATLPSSLPLEAIAAALEGEGLPVEWSDDAGGYLCNTVFTLSRAHAVPGLAPEMSGFVHVPPLVDDEPGHAAAMTLADLERGARAIVDAALATWNAR